MRRPYVLGLAACLQLVASPGSQAARDGVILLYHHVADDTPASTSVTIDAFRAQLDYLERGGFNVMPVLELVRALENGDEVPDRSVAITFDDAYRSILSNALPELAARGWPFTVFVSTEGIDDGYAAYLSWDELRYLGERGATIGNHSVTHTHLVRQAEGESSAVWRRRVRGEIEAAEARLAAEVDDYRVPVFAYPYGEYTAAIKAIVADLGLYGLGQHSGAVGPTSDFFALPRYPIATDLGLTESEFALRVRSRALPVRLVGDEQHIVGDDEAPALRLALEGAGDVRLVELACYASGLGRMSLEWADAAMTAFVARPAGALGSGRSKYNCTAPSASTAGVYYWYGYLWMKRQQDGRWYDE
jgi:peptidoglycan/xylan/chitin deacetylase (PgdA/CDA1 family)